MVTIFVLNADFPDAVQKSVLKSLFRRLRGAGGRVRVDGSAAPAQVPNDRERGGVARCKSIIRRRRGRGRRETRSRRNRFDNPESDPPGATCCGALLIIPSVFFPPSLSFSRSPIFFFLRHLFSSYASSVRASFFYRPPARSTFARETTEMGAHTIALADSRTLDACLARFRESRN